MRRVGATVAAAGILVAVVAGCSSSKTPSAASQSSTAATASVTSVGGVQRVTIHTTDRLRFMPDTITLHPGKVQITLINDGSYPHNISVPSLHITSKSVNGDPGQQSTMVTLDLTKAGTYPFVCTYHSSAGMRGQLVVT
jgi:plastocyanin